LLTATEASGDLLGAALMTGLRERLGDEVAFIGVGGARMAAAGLQSLFDPAELAVLGAVNALAVYPKVLRRARDVADLAARERPDAAILIDAWGFSLRVARGIRRHAAQVKIIKYVAPQVWATRPGRAKTLARTVDHLLTLHNFDAAYFEAEGLPTTFVGNPALARDFSAADGSKFRARTGIAADAPLLLVLPGSRAGEVERLSPPFGDAARRLKARIPNLEIVVAAAETVEAAVRAAVLRWPVPVTITTGEADRLSAMKSATAALACSGTVTTELALAGCPFVVGYKLDPLTYQIAKRLLRTRWITLINVAAADEVAPEFIQKACAGDRLAESLAPWLTDDDRRLAQTKAQAAALRAMLGDIGAAKSAADVVIELLGPGGALFRQTLPLTGRGAAREPTPAPARTAPP
jgi:lipid-A-disaccharide synthase